MFLTGLPDFKGLVANLQNVRLLKIGTVCKNLIFDDSRHFGSCLKVTHFYRLLTLTVLVSAKHKLRFSLHPPPPPPPPPRNQETI